MKAGFERALEHIRIIAGTEAEKGRLFERLMKAYLGADPLYGERFSGVWLWSEWVAEREGFSGNDIGIDLVAEERSGGFCAIQCKCYAESTKISKGDLDSFVSASARDPFTSRMVIDTGDEWGANAKKVIEPPEACMHGAALCRLGGEASGLAEPGDAGAGETESSAGGVRPETPSAGGA